MAAFEVITEGGAAEGAVEDGNEELRMSKPVGGGEGLCTEGTAAMSTAEPLDASLVEAAEVEAVALVAPTG